MKILFIGSFKLGWDESICDEEHIAQALELSGHKVERIDRGAVGEARNSYMCDFVLISQWYNYHPDMMKNLKDYTGKPIVYWAFDYQPDGQEWHEILIAGADLYLSKRISDSKYPNWSWLAQDFAPALLHRVPSVEGKDIDVLFTGSWADYEESRERRETLKAIDDKFNLHIYGVTPSKWEEAGFKNVHGPAVDDKLPELIARAKINISIDNFLEIGYWSDRNAQIMACGGFVLYRHVPMSEAIFKSYVAYFYNQQDCLEKIEYFLEHEDQREWLADMGYKYARQMFTPLTRATELLTLVGSIL